MRYSAVGYLAVRYGEQASELLRDHFILIVSAVVTVAACVIAVQAFRRRIAA